MSQVPRHHKSSPVVLTKIIHFLLSKSQIKALHWKWLSTLKIGLNNKESLFSSFHFAQVCYTLRLIKIEKALYLAVYFQIIPTGKTTYFVKHIYFLINYDVNKIPHFISLKAHCFQTFQKYGCKRIQWHKLNTRINFFYLYIVKREEKNTTKIYQTLFTVLII